MGIHLHKSLDINESQYDQFHCNFGNLGGGFLRIIPSSECQHSYVMYVLLYSQLDIF